MLTQLLKLLEQNQGEVDLITLSRQLNAQPGAVAGMIETLLHKGRLVEIKPACGDCHHCPIENGCPLPARRARQIAVVSNQSGR